MSELQVPHDAGVAELRRSVDALNRLVQVSLVMNSTLAIRPLLQFIIDAAAEITEAEAASILLLDERTQELHFAASTGSDQEKLEQIVVPIEGSLAGTILTENRALIVDDAAHDPRHFQQVGKKIEFETRSLLGVPMRIKDRLVGVLEAINKGEGRFNDEDVRRLTILASQAAVAIENARLVAALRKAYDELNALDKLKSDFIAIASHELRTPLGVILGYASFLKDDASDEMSEHIDQVLNSALHLRNLIEDMTNLRYVQLSDADLNIEEAVLNEILNAAHSDVLTLAEAKGHALLIELPPQPVLVRADRAKLEMAITNILNNAVKFTPEGGIIALDVEQHSREAWIRVRDNGLGVPKDQLVRIFDQFHQAEDHMTRRHGGLGLGLAIAKGIIERHGGRIWAESEGKGRGSTFTMTIPLAQPRAVSGPLGTGTLPGADALPMTGRLSDLEE